MKANTKSLLLRLLVHLSIIITTTTTLSLLGYILYKGMPHINIGLFSINYTSENSSLLPALINTISIVAISLLISVPIGIFSAIHFVEYTHKDNRFVKIMRSATETLQGIPSIVYGLFGYLFFVTAIFKTYCLIAGAFTLAIIILPLIIRTTEEALKSVPDSLRESSFALGAGKLQTVFKIVLPSAANGIFAGIVLAIGRIIGETVALVYTAGSVAQISKSLFSSGRTLSVHMYSLWTEGLKAEQSYATAVILIITVFILNLTAEHISRKIKR